MQHCYHLDLFTQMWSCQLCTHPRDLRTGNDIQTGKGCCREQMLVMTSSLLKAAVPRCGVLYCARLPPCRLLLPQVLP